MRRKILIGTAAMVLFLLGMSVAVAGGHAHSDDWVQQTYSRSPDCKYPPCY